MSESVELIKLSADAIIVRKFERKTAKILNFLPSIYPTKADAAKITNEHLSNNNSVMF